MDNSIYWRSHKGSVNGCSNFSFQDCFIYTCDLCGKRQISRSQLEIHLDDDHDQDASFIPLDEPPYRLRKLGFYQKKVRLIVMKVV